MESKVVTNLWRKAKPYILTVNLLIYFATVLIGGLIVLFNYEFLLSYQRGKGFTPSSLYEVVFVNLVLSSVFLAKLSLPKVLDSHSQKFNEFFEINNETKPIKFSVFVNFLSEQALGGMNVDTHKLFIVID